MPALHEVFEQTRHRIRVDWGRRGARAAAARGDALVVVDVLSFSTATITAVARGARIRPCRWEEDAAALAKRLGAEFAVRRDEVPEKGRYSLSPGSLEDVPAGTKLVVGSPNGATCAELAGRVERLAIGALVNASAVAARVNEWLEAGCAATVIACGERWKDDSEDGRLRFAIEDHLGAGAIVASLSGDKSPEARLCEAAFVSMKSDLDDVITNCGSGLELGEMGYPDDVECALAVDRFDVVPVMKDGWLVASQDS